MTSSTTNDIEPSDKADLGLFEVIAQDILAQGYSVQSDAIDSELLEGLCEHLAKLPSKRFKRAGVGRHINHGINDQVRGDEICWINDECEAEAAWLGWAESLQHYLNRRLYLGLFSFESHFAHYGPGDFYKKHQDAFRGDANRVLSLVLYLNTGWQAADGGELIIYPDQTGDSIAKVIPNFGTLAIFLSEEFPHEVLPARCDRYSIAGWFRVNNSSADRVDPPK